MNAQQQDIIRLLTARGPMTSRLLFDFMQDELGYWSQASTHDQIQRGIESLSKILSKMKTENLINGEMTAQGKGRPVMVWSAPITEKSDGEIYAETSARHAPQELHDMAKSMTVHDDHISKSAEMESDIAELSSFAVDIQPSSHLLIMTDTKRILSGDNCVMNLKRAPNQLHVCLRGDMEIHNRAELAQFIGAIERMLP